jgi:hypothetical protein
LEDELGKVTPRKQPNILTIGASRSYAVRGVGVDRLVSDIVGSNTAQGMVDVCSRLPVLCCPVYVEASATGWSLAQTSPTKCHKNITKPPV